VVVFSPRVMDEHRAITQATISDRGGAAASRQQESSQRATWCVEKGENIILLP
jgi:hypothetical protein